MSRQSFVRYGVVWIVAALGVLVAPAWRAWGDEKAAAKGEGAQADVKATAKAVWTPERRYGKQTPPTLRVFVRLHGPADQASASGALAFETLLDQNGKSHRQACEVIPAVGDSVRGICRNLNGESFSGVELEFAIPNRPAIESIRELSGSIVLETGGQAEVVTISDAFKRLIDQKDLADADPDEWARPLTDKKLESLGLKASVIRKAVEEVKKTDGPAAKDRVLVKIESKSCAVTGCEVLDATGKTIPGVGATFEAERPNWSFDVPTSQVVPGDGRLRLTIQKGDRRVRVPFVVRDVAIPKIAKGDKALDIATMSDEAYAEAKRTLPKDPILADMKVTGKAEWRPEFGEDHKAGPPTLGVTVSFGGKAARDACAFGQVRIQSAIGQDGKNFRRLCRVFRGEDMEHRFRKDMMGQRREEPIEFRVDMANRPQIESFRKIVGSVTLETGGEEKTAEIRNAFKDLGKPVTESELSSAVMDGDEHWIAKRLDDPSLKGTTLEVALRRIVVPPDESNAKDRVIIQVESDDPIVDGDILDAAGKPLNYSVFFFAGDAPMWQFHILTKEKIPADARLRLVLMKNTRTIRAPFELTNVAVPKIDEKDERLNVPASNEGVFEEAAAVRLDDPIVDGLKITAKVDWIRWADRPADLTVHLELLGKALAQVSECGEGDIEVAVDDRGVPLEFPTGEAEMRGTFWNPANKPSVGVSFRLPGAKPFRKIGELRGTFSLRTGGQFETIILKDFLKKAKEKRTRRLVDDAELKKLGVAVAVEQKKKIGPEFGGVEDMSLEFHWKRIPVVWCEVLDAAGQPLPEGNSTWGGSSGAANWWRAFKQPVPDDAQLKITIHKNGRKISVPFAFKDVKVPEVPKKGDTGPVMVPAVRAEKEKE